MRDRRGRGTVGFSFRKSKYSITENFHLLERKKITTLECTHAMLQTLEKSNRLNNKTVIHLDTLFDEATSTHFFEYSKAIQKSFQEEAIQLIQSLPKHVSTIMIDIALETLLNGEDKSNHITFLKSLAPALLEKKIRLLFPLNIPSINSDDMAYFLQHFIMELALPCFGVLVRIYPHSIKGDVHPKKMLRWVRFDMDHIQFIYDADKGNSLVKKLLDPWFDYFTATSYNRSITFCPGNLSLPNLEEEITKIAKIIK